MVIPGGHIEAGETPDETVVREVAEETTVKIVNPRLIFVEEHTDAPDDRWGTQYIYLCGYGSGEPTLNPESEEYALQQKGQELYEPQWFSLEQLPDAEYPFLSRRLGTEILKGHAKSFPKQTKTWRRSGL